MRTVPLLLFGLFGAGGFVWAQPKVARDLSGLAPEASVDVLVHFRRPIDDAQAAKIRLRGGAELGRFPRTGFIVASIEARRVAELAREADIDYIAPDRRVKALLDTSRGATMAEFAFQTGVTGQGVGVAVIDSGIGDHPDILRSRVAHSEGFGVAGAGDEYGHGTPVASLIGGSGLSSGGRYRGIAPGVRFINLRVLGPDGEGRDSAVIAAIDRAIDWKNRYNIRVINLSLGRPPVESYKQDPLGRAVEAAWRAGIVVVVAAGNEGRHDAAGNKGYATILAPANHPLVITVGALKTLGTTQRDDDVIASYSSKGPAAIDHVLKPDLIAPGNLVVAAQTPGAALLKRQYPANSLNGNYFRLSGTSVSASLVTGAVALLLERTPGLTPDQVKARLMKSAWKSFPPETVAIDPASNAEYVSRHDALTVGAGALDINAALNSTELPVGTAASPELYYHTGSDTVRLRFAFNVLWGSSVVWTSSLLGGPNTIWGNNIVAGTYVVWGSNAVWGVSSLRGFYAIWGPNPVWLSPAAARRELTWSPFEAIAGER